MIYDILYFKDMASAFPNKFSYLANQNPAKIRFYHWA